MIELIADMVPTITTWGKIREREDKAFESGRELGYEQAIEVAQGNKFKVTAPLTEKDNQKLIDFLIENNMELCYNTFKGGFRVRKMMSDRKHAMEMLARQTKRELNDRG